MKMALSTLLGVTLFRTALSPFQVTPLPAPYPPLPPPPSHGTPSAPSTSPFHANPGFTVPPLWPGTRPSRSDRDGSRAGPRTSSPVCDSDPRGRNRVGIGPGPRRGRTVLAFLTPGPGPGPVRDRGRDRAPGRPGDSEASRNPCCPPARQRAAGRAGRWPGPGPGAKPWPGSGPIPSGHYLTCQDSSQS